MKKKAVHLVFIYNDNKSILLNSSLNASSIGKNYTQITLKHLISGVIKHKKRRVK